MTTEQLATLKNWIATQSTQDTAALLQLIHARPVTGYNDWIEQRDRDRVTVAAETQMKTVAASAGITTADTPAQIQSKLLAWIADADAAQKPDRCFKSSVALSTYITFRTMDVTGEATTTIHHHDPIMGQSYAEELGLGPVTGTDIERALRCPINP
jgi:hypothetical protein